MLIMLYHIEKWPWQTKIVACTVCPFPTYKTPAVIFSNYCVRCESLIYDVYKSYIDYTANTIYILLWAYCMLVEDMKLYMLHTKAPRVRQ